MQITKAKKGVYHTQYKELEENNDDNVDDDNEMQKLNGCYYWFMYVYEILHYNLKKCTSNTC